MLGIVQKCNPNITSKIFSILFILPISFSTSHYGVIVPVGPSQNKSGSSLENDFLPLADPCSYQAVDPRYMGVRSSKPSCPCMITLPRPRLCAMGPLPPLLESGLHSNKIRICHAPSLVLLNAEIQLSGERLCVHGI